MCVYPLNMVDEELEAEDAGFGGETVYMLKNGEALELNVPDDPDGEEDHDNVDYD